MYQFVNNTSIIVFPGPGFRRRRQVKEALAQEGLQETAALGVNPEAT